MSSLAELELNRNLYKTPPQTLETLSADDVAANVPAPPSNAVASGNTVIDINSNSMTINGSQLTPGTIPQTTLDIANWGWTQTSVFSVVDADTVQWGAGTFTSADGTSVYSIGAGNTGNMAAITYVYLDINISTTAYQTTTSQTTAIGIGKVLIAVCQNGGAAATFNTVQGHQIVGDNIIANTIAAQKLNVSQLSAISADLGTITAGTVTSATIQTAATGKRLKMAGSPQNEYQFLDGATGIGSLKIDDDGTGGYVAQIIIDSLGPISSIMQVGYGIGASTEVPFFSAPFFQSSGRAAVGNVSMYGGPDSLQGFGIDWSGGGDATLQILGIVDSDVEFSGTITFDSQVNFDGTVAMSDVLTYKTTPMPRVFHGYVNSDGTAGTPFPSGWSSAHTATGRYTITHDLSSTSYSVVATAQASTVKNITIESRNSDTFVVRIANLSDTLEDNNFMFILCRTA